MVRKRSGLSLKVRIFTITAAWTQWSGMQNSVVVPLHFPKGSWRGHSHSYHLKPIVIDRNVSFLLRHFPHIYKGFHFLRNSFRDPKPPCSHNNSPRMVITVTLNGALQSETATKSFRPNNSRSKFRFSNILDEQQNDLWINQATRQPVIFVNNFFLFVQG